MASRRAKTGAATADQNPSQPQPKRNALEATYVKRRTERDGGAWAVSEIDDIDGLPAGTKGCIVGPMPDPRPGSRIRVFDPISNDHPIYGKQWKYKDYEWAGFSDLRGMARHIADVCEGVGDTISDRIVAAFGQQSIEVLRDDPERAAREVRGLRLEVAHEAAEALRKKAHVERLSVMLRGVGVGPKRVATIIKEYGVEKAFERIHENPWLLADEVDGIGFATADKLAMRLGHAADSPLRAKSAVLHFVREACRMQGDCKVLASEVAAEAGKVGIPESALALAVESMSAVDADGNPVGGPGGAMAEPVASLPAPPPMPDPNSDSPDGDYGEVLGCLEDDGDDEDEAFGPIRTKVLRVLGAAGEPPMLAPAELLDAEVGIWDKVKRMLAAPHFAHPWIDRVNETGYTQDPGGTKPDEQGQNAAPKLDEYQRAALDQVRDSNVSVVTGGPGTGKSHLIRSVYVALTPKSRVLVLAPTGKAAVRGRAAPKAQGTNMPSFTIHMALARAQESKLDADVVLVDETSMVDSALMARLLAALPDRASIHFFGDVDQLPPVSPGCPFKDLIEGGVVPVARLLKIHRVRETSWIALNARAINEGKKPNLDGDGAGAPDDFFLVARGDNGTADTDLAPQQTIVDIVAHRLPAKCMVDEIDPETGERSPRPVDPRRDVQVISPMWERGLCGVSPLNEALRAQINPPTGPAGLGGFRPGDKVVQKKNDYSLLVMNGEVGIVQAIGKKGDLVPKKLEGLCRAGAGGGETGIPAKKTSGGPAGTGGDYWTATGDWLVVDYDGRPVAYRDGQVGPLQLAFALTIHSTQGSQFPYIVIPVVRAYSWFFSRQMLYTAVTRAQRMVILVGTEADLKRAVANTKMSKRRTFLIEWLAAAQAAEPSGRSNS